MNDTHIFAGIRVLIIEDEALVSMMLEEFLEQIGCKMVGTASRLDDAIIKARSLPVDMALLDVNLAGEASFPVAEILTARDIPFIFVTGYGALGLPAEMRHIPVLPKPFHMAQLIDAMRMAAY
ncbi:response regulator [Neorhizobium sp. IRAMC:178]|uniref:response regulator n=1 Tax=Neorhizobium tunisiense TaxID=3144793 RepID=UPI0031F6F782